MPLSWLTRLESAIYEMDETPLLISRSAFDLENFSNALSQKLKVDGFKIQMGQTKWLSSDELYLGMGTGADFLGFTVSPLSGSLFWIMNPEDIAKLSSWLLLKDTKHKEFSSEILQEGFYHYLLLESLDAFQNIPLFQNLSIKMDLNTPLPQDGALAIDVEIKYNKASVWGRILLSKAFQQSWKGYSHQLMPHPFKVEIARNYDLTLGLKIAEVSLDQKTVKSLRPGDFVLLDRVSFDFPSKKGVGMLTLNGHSLISVSIEKNACKIIDEALYQEGIKMNENFEDNTDEEHFFEDEIKSEEEEEKVSPPEEVKEASLSLKDIPLSLTIEVARIKMSLDKLMKLEPGNLLELPVHPNESVVLTVEGKKIGSAELVYLGDALGIRIIEIGR